MPDTEIYDVLSVGFGPAAVALAISIVEHDSSPQASPRPRPAQFASLGGLQATAGASLERGDLTLEGDLPAGIERKLRACFVERYDAFSWHPGMMLEGSRMQISFLKDLATPRNPSSPYTFLAYLHSLSPSRLFAFITLQTFTPTRREFADYLAWAARKVELELASSSSTVAFSEHVTSITPVLEESTSSSSSSNIVRLLRVTSQNSAGATISRLTRNVILSTGGVPRLPSCLEGVAPDRVMHSSEYLLRIGAVLDRAVEGAKVRGTPVRIAVVGGGQSSTEIFLAVRETLALRLRHRGEDVEGRAQVEMLLRKMCLKATEESPFANEVFDPGMSQAVYGLDDVGRVTVIREAHNTNYSVVNPNTLKSLYETMYAQRVEEDISAREGTLASLDLDPKLSIHPYSQILLAAPTPDGISLTIKNTLTHQTSSRKFDVILCGTGYDRQAWKSLLFPPSSSTSSSTSNPTLGDIFPTSSSPSASHHATSPPPLSLPAHLFSSDPRSTSPTSSTSFSNDSPTTTSPSTPPSCGSSHCGETSPPSRVPYAVTEDYRLDLPDLCEVGGVKRTFEPRVWLQGSNEATHGVSDSLLSVLAIRSGEVLESILKHGAK